MPLNALGLFCWITTCKNQYIFKKSLILQQARGQRIAVAGQGPMQAVPAQHTVLPARPWDPLPTKLCYRCQQQELALLWASLDFEFYPNHRFLFS